MITLQDLLKDAYDSSGDYLSALNKALGSINSATKLSMNNVNYLSSGTPSIVKGSISTDVSNFEPTRLEFGLISTDGSSKISMSEPYNLWASQKGATNLSDQYRNMYEYIMNIDPINIEGKYNMQSDDYEDMMDNIKSKMRKKELVRSNYDGANNAINVLDNLKPISASSNIGNNVNEGSFSPIDNFNKMISKNPEKRFAKNYNFVFGEDYMNNSDFKNAVDNFINNNKNVYDSIYQKVMNADTGVTKESIIAYSNMLNFVSEKNNTSIPDIQSKMLNLAGDQKEKLLESFPSNKEAFDSLGLDSSIWNEPIITKNASIDDFKKNTQKFFDESGASVEDIVNNFDSYFSQAMKETDFSNIDGQALMDYRNELKKSYDDRWTQETEKAAQEKIRQREIEIENKKKNAKASDTEYWNGQQKRSTMDLEDGVKAEFFYNENGEVVVQKLIYPDGKRDISVRRTAEDLERFTPDELDGAQRQVSKKRLIRDGNIIEMSEVPDSMYAKNTTVDLNTGDVEVKHRLRDRPWGGGTQEEEIINSKLKTSNVNNETPIINNNFRGNKNNRTPQEQFIDKIIGKQNPGNKTSRVFNYNGKEYAIFDNLEINAKDLSKGITGGRVVDLETNELIEAREAFPEINQALMDGDVDTALEKINSFEESKHTFSKDELNERIVNKHTNNTEQQNQNHQESRNRQHNRNQEQQAEQQEEFENSRTEQRQENKDNHAEHTNQNKPDPDTNRPPNTDTDNTRTRQRNNADPDIDANISSKRRRKSNRTPRTKTKSIDLKQVIMRSFIDEVIETAEETIDETLENTAKNTAKSKMNWERINMKHPDQMGDLEIADLTDEEIKMFANGNKGKIEEWTGRRDKARANKVLDHYMNNSSGDYYSNGEYRNPYQYNTPEMDFEVDADGNTTINKTGKNRTVEVEENKPFKMQQADKMNQKLLSGAPNNLDDVLDWMKSHKLGMLDIGMNVYGTISTYKESRRQGRGVVSSAVRAAADFAIFEMLGPLASFGVQAARTLPGLAIKGVDLLYKENRKMNSAANNQLFGDAQFYDTQQLATMRQSGMEMAKMAQYNLQQTLMGNEATYLHR